MANFAALTAFLRACEEHGMDAEDIAAAKSELREIRYAFADPRTREEARAALRELAKAFSAAAVRAERCERWKL